MTTAIIPAHQVAPLWRAYHGLPAAGHEMRAAVVIEPVRFTGTCRNCYQEKADHVAYTLRCFPGSDEHYEPITKTASYRVTSGQPLYLEQ